MDYLKSRRIVKKKLLIETLDKNVVDVHHLAINLAKALQIPKRFLFCYGEQELQEHNNRR